MRQCGSPAIHSQYTPHVLFEPLARPSRLLPSTIAVSPLLTPRIVLPLPPTGSLRSNAMGTNFVLHTSIPHMPPETLATFYKKPSVISKIGRGGRPRDLYTALYDASASDRHTASPPAGSLLDEARGAGNDPTHRSTARADVILCRNKQPYFDGKHFRLKMGSRVEVASVKNFQLIEHNTPTDDRASLPGSGVLVQFGKVTNNDFHLDFKAPFSRTCVCVCVCVCVCTTR